jgi:hypothetical protein
MPCSGGGLSVQFLHYWQVTVARTLQLGGKTLLRGKEEAL